MKVHETRGVRLGTLLVVYHRAFWRAADGSLWEREGAFSRYLESCFRQS